MTDIEPQDESTINNTDTILPTWFFKLIFVVASRIAEWAMKKAGIKPDQHEKAEDGTEKIKDASDKIEDTEVNVEDRDPDDIFDNTDFNS